MPLISGSSESAVIAATSSSVVVEAGSSTWREVMPALAQRFCFMRT